MEVRGKREGLGPSRTTSRGYDTQIDAPHCVNESYGPALTRKTKEEASVCLVYLFVVIPFILDARLHLSVKMWTHQPGSHRGKTTLLTAALALFFFREKDSAFPFPRRP